MKHAFNFFAVVVLSCRLACAAEPTAVPKYSEHQDLTYYVKNDGTRVTLHTPADWQQRRAHILAGIEEVMGPLPRPGKPIRLDVEVLEEQQADGIVRRKIAYHTDCADSKVKAWLLLPLPSGEGRGEGESRKSPTPRAAILCLHQTTPNGKDSPVGLSDRPTLHYALELARRGYVTLSPDYPSFGEHPYDFDADDYPSGSIKAIYDNMRAIDVLQSLPEVNGDRIGCIGHSLGGHNSLFTAVFDERIKAVVTSCGFTRFHKYYGGNLKGWTSGRYMPLIASRYDSNPDRMPFDFPEVLAAIAPRAVFVMAPLHDDNFDNSGVRDCVAAAEPIFKLLGAADHLVAVYPGAAHDFPDAERKQSYEFFDRVLKHAD